MAQIPLGNFGNRTPEASLTPTARLDTSATDAAMRAGAVLTGIGGTILAKQEHEATLAAERAAVAKTALAHVNIQNGLAERFDEINADVLSGKTDKIEATSLWKEAASTVVSENLKTAPADRAELLSAQAKGMEGKLTNSLFDTFRKKDDQDAIAGVSAAEEGLQRIATKDLQGAIKQHGMLIDGSPLPADQKALRKQKFIEGAYYNDFRRQAQGAMQSGSVDALDAVQQKLAGPEGDALDPTKRNTLDQTIFGWKQNIEAKAARNADKAERDATKRFNTATDTINKARDIALEGGFIAPEYIATMVEQAQGTGLEKDVQELLASQKAVAGFASRPPAVRAAALESARAERADPKIGIDPLGQKQLNRAEQIDASLRKKVDDGDAWSAAQSVGIIPAAPLLDIRNPQEAITVFQQRVRDIGTVEAWAGKKISPLQPDEADQFTRMLRTLKPDQAASLLGQAGAALGDSDRIAALAKQVGDKDGTLGLAMAYASSKTTEGRYTAELILQGEQLIKDKAVRVDGMVETGWRAAIAKQVRGAYSNQEVESRVIDAAFRIAAAKNGDVDNAINLAAGGIIERNGGKIPLPYGMKEGEFEKRLAAITPGNLEAQTPGGVVVVGPNRVPVADFVKTLPDARLVHAGQGVYNVRAGNQLVTNDRGQRIMLKVGP